MNPLLARVVREHRLILIPLVVALVANLGVYLVMVRPMANRSAGAAELAAAATQAVEGAAREQAAAADLVAGKARADEALDAFYGKVLPGNLTAARRLTYSSLPALAQRTKVHYETRRFDAVEAEKDARVATLKIRMVLQGEYANLRQFIYQLESAPEFVIIDQLTLTEGQAGETLTLHLDLSTYYTVRPNGA
jgi:Tfp pilus assembly protein PilO